jgi:hypothetical protein
MQLACRAKKATPEYLVRRSGAIQKECGQAAFVDLLEE